MSHLWDDRDSGIDNAASAARDLDVAPRPSVKRTRAFDHERPSKFIALGGSGRFGGLERDEYLQTRVHPKLHIQAQELGDEELWELGQQNYSKQFSEISVLRGSGDPGDLFGHGGREAYMQQHVHRKLHPRAVALGDQELLELGRLSFNDQFGVFEQVANLTGQAPLRGQGQSGDLFGGATRDAYMQQHVHRKLHSKAVELSDQDLAALGKLSFNEQFPFLGAEGDSGAARGAPLRAADMFLGHSRDPAAARDSHLRGDDLFMGHGRDTYMAARVHRRLHAQAAQLGDQELFDLGQLSFNQQFTFLENSPAVKSAPKHDLFGPAGRDAYLQQRVHRKLHPKACLLDDQELFDLGKLNFNDQFPVMEQLEVVPVPAAVPTSSSVQVQEQPPPSGMFGGLSRDAYMAARVHRRLHPQAALLSDHQLRELGQLSFNQQFPYFENTPVTQPPPQQQQHQQHQQQLHQHRQPQVQAAPAALPPKTDVFGGLGREDYMQRRIHRKLHAKAAILGDEELYELGRLSFNEQFPLLEHVEPAAAFGGLQQGSADMFGGMGRESYMQQRVHRKLHPQAASLTDSQLFELGKMSFNQQFPYFEAGAEAQLVESQPLLRWRPPDF
uniref:Uncharacterized protein n=1 Tax=Alexandrium monilatum TaxID=311494 RepID=A0A7S4UIE5_9DINO